MKFLKITNSQLKLYNFKKHNYNYKYFDLFYDFDKYCIKKRKIFNKIKLGVSKNLKKNSLKRDSNNTYVQQLTNLFLKRGVKTIIFKNLNLMLENVNIFINDLKFNTNYKNNNYFYNLIYFKQKDLNFIIFNFLNDFESIFDLKTKKNDKNSKKGKYLHEIVYIPKKRRFKYVLKYLYLHTNNYKNNKFWERIFWALISSISSKDCFLNKRKIQICLKSIKFFKNNK